MTTITIEAAVVDSPSDISYRFYHALHHSAVSFGRGLARCQLAAGKNRRRRAHERFTLYLFEAGRLELRRARETPLRVEADEILLLPPGWTFVMSARDDARWLEIQLNLITDSDLLRHPLEELELPLQLRAPDPPRLHELCELLGTIAGRAHHEDRQGRLACRHALQEIYDSFFLQAMRNDMLRARHRSPRWFDTVLDDIGKHYRQPDLRIGDVAERVDRTIKEVQHAFRNYLQTTFSAHVGSLRIRHAQLLLNENAELSVARIAARCGYRSTSLFYRQFRRLVGSSPRRKSQIAAHTRAR